MSVHISLKNNNEKAIACLDFWGGLTRAAGDEEANKRITSQGPALLKEEKWAQILIILIETSGVLWKLASTKEIESCVTLLITLTKDAVPTAQQSDIVVALANSVVSGQSEKDVRSLKMKLLVSCFNYFPDQQYQLMTSALTLLSKSEPQLRVTLVSLDALCKYISQWKVTAKQQFDLLKLYSDNLKPGEHRVNALKRSIAPFNGAGDVPPEALVAARQVVVSSIGLPHVYVFDALPKLAAVAALATSADHKGVFQLLEVFVNGGIEEYKKYQSTFPGVVKSLGLDEKRVEDKIRLLTLVTVCTNKTVLSYEEGAKAIGVASGKEFARWSIRAIGESVINGRLDELGQNLKLGGTIQRTFEKQHWQQLQAQLESFLVALDTTTALEVEK